MKIISDKKYRARLFKAGKESFWVFGGQLGVAAGTLLGIKILTQVLTPGEYGRFSLANTMILIAGITFFSPLGQGVMRYWSIARQRGQMSSYIRASNRLVAILMGLVFLISVIVPVLLMLTPWKGWGILTGLCIIAGGIAGGGGVRIFVLMAARQRKLVAVIHTAAAFMKPLIGAAIAYAFIANTEAVVSGYLLAAIILFYIIERAYRKIAFERDNNLVFSAKESKKQKDQIGRELLAFSWPFFLWGIFSWIHQFCDRWSIMAYHGADVVGAFSVIGQLAVYPLLFGVNFLNVFFIPIAYESAGDLGSAKSLKSAQGILFTMMGFYIIGTAGLIFFFAVFHYKIVLLVSNNSYTSLSYLLPWLTLAWAFYYFGQMLSSFGFLENKPRLYIGPVLVSGISASALTFYLSSVAGPAGVVVGLAIAGFIYAFWIMIICAKLLK